MENKEFYTLKEIIFGLRSEYKKNEKELTELKSFCVCDKNKVAGFDFSLFKVGRQKTEIICRILKRENIVQKLLREFNHFLKLSNINEVICTKNNNSYYINEDIVIPDSKNKQFSSKASDILNSIFNLNINGDISLNVSGFDLVINTKFDRLNVFVSDGRSVVSNLSYHSKSDSIKLMFLMDKKISNELINNILSIKVSEKELNSYHINMIDMSGILDKEIVLENLPRNKSHLEIMIKDDSDKIVLSKIKK